MSGPCDRVWEIDLYRGGQLPAKAASSFARHLQACADCRMQLERDEVVRQLARRLPDPAPDDLTLRRLQARILREAAMGVPARTVLANRWGLAAAMVGVLAIVAVVLVASRSVSRSRGSAGPVAGTSSVPDTLPGRASASLAGSVVASTEARWRQTRDQDIERVVLDDGTIRVHVRPQVDGERFLVVMPDGQLEVRGTTFEVSVANEATTYVHVDEGVVELRLRDHQVMRLSATDAYHASTQPVTSAAPPHARPSRVAPSPPVASAPPATPRPEEDNAYAEAVALMNQGRNDQAASAFHAVSLAEAGSSQAEDASFLEVVAIARAGRTDAAALAAEHYLSLFPRSFHRREAAILVIRAAGERGDCNKARALMAQWEIDARELQGALGPCDGKAR